jgi:glyoxylase-like metal-dependent hydrolase (beta-lactamase superfamily II)
VRMTPARLPVAGALCAALLLAACSTIHRSTASVATRDPRAPLYEVYAVRFAKSPQDRESDYVVGGDSTRPLEGVYMVWALRAANGRVALVDAGFYREKFMPRWKPVDFVPPSEALRQIGIEARDVRDIILTHIHWDHVDGVDLFPRADVWMQRAEFDYYVDSAGGVRHRGADPDDAASLARLKNRGRMTLVDGDGQEILPGVRVYTGGKHTYASQYVAVPTRSGTVVLASDNAYVYENLERRLPISQTLDTAANLRAQDRMFTIAAARPLVIPGHDAQVFVRFPKVARDVVRID